MPRLARHGSVRLTNMLVTAEVTAFVVGPAISGLIIGLGLAEWSIWAAAALAVIGWPLLHGLGHAPAAVDATRVVGGRLRAVLTSPGVPLAIGMVALVNFVEGGVSVALINLNATRWGADERGFGIATAALGFGSLAAPLLIMVLRLRGSLLVTGGGFAAAGLAPTVALAVGPLAIAGAAGTAVECASTDVLQRSVPDRFRAFSLGLTDSIMVAAAMLGSFLVPLLSSGIGAPAAFVVSGVGVVAAAAFWQVRARSARSPDRSVMVERTGRSVGLGAGRRRQENRMRRAVAVVLLVSLLGCGTGRLTPGHQPAESQPPHLAHSPVAHRTVAPPRRTSGTPTPHRADHPHAQR